MSIKAYNKTGFVATEGSCPELHMLDNYVSAQDCTKENHIADKSSMVRFYCKNWPDSFLFQIRAMGPVVDGGKERFIIASCTLNIKDVEDMLAYMKARAKR